MDKKIKLLEEVGQSLWLDFISRDSIKNGELESLIKKYNIKGLTSNPVIFEKSISNNKNYKEDILQLKEKKLSNKEIYETLFIKDIIDALDLLTPIYESSNKKDGYVSLEVSPLLAHNEEETFQEAMKLWKTINRPNLMIKVPATNEGILAIRKLIYYGLNINVTLLFDISYYQKAALSYLNGLNDRLKENKCIKNIHSVASFFISRIDTKLDEKLPENSPHRGRMAIMNAINAYMEFINIYDLDLAKKILECGGNKQRLLWASTGTKNPKYSKSLYVESLLLKDTVNTLPLETIQAFFEDKNIGQKEAFSELLFEGIKLFENGFLKILDTIERT